MDTGNRTITANNKDQPDRATQFVAALDELAEFNDYFTDDAKVQQLVDWLHARDGNQQDRTAAGGTAGGAFCRGPAGVTGQSGWQGVDDAAQ